MTMRWIRWKCDKNGALKSRFWIILAILVVLSIIVIIVRMLGHTLDTSRNSTNANQTLKRAQGYPLTGFWKGDYSQDYGLLIEPTKEIGIYSISPCGVRGCYPPGKFHPNSSIVNDSKYRVIDDNTIVVYEDGGESATNYKRCE